MRKFESSRFRDDYVDALSSSHLYDFPDEQSRNALKYVNQFVQRGSRELLKGYMPKKYAGALVRLRDENSSRDLNAVVGALCVDGGVSTSDTEFSSFKRLQLPCDRDLAEELDDEYYEVDLKESKVMIRTVQDIIRYGGRRDEIEIWIPTEVVEEVENFS
jgi:hypothetical protein